ncbi:hypothetical protein WA1_50690 [Scytonema hofmannii PCC 7110]|uniref:Uncharacterized protein n=1 Tax=Scytonema hofmannii PCC 7110 TaxID=128403 RepID=A0A139WQG8_9CYAN|nr:hypothetical protein [Scytonema hofmannii]KYC34681.1 hypothetical protein WA1_50690 [Scytonema hofmannii PCC 7110]
MKNQSSYRKPKLNKKQRAWVNKFIASRPNSRLTNIIEGLSGDRIVIIEWWSRTNAVILDSHTLIEGSLSYRIEVKLRRCGVPRHTAVFEYKIKQPEKKSVPYHLWGQLSLYIPQCYAVRTPTNPIVVKLKREIKTKKLKKFVQHTLPLEGISAELHQINIRHGGIPKSKQELLAETTSYLDVNTNKEVVLPSAIVQILQEKQASLDEWESAISLYQVGSPSCVLHLTGRQKS